MLSKHAELGLGSSLTIKTTVERRVDNHTLRLEQTDSGIIKLFIDTHIISREYSKEPVTSFYNRDAEIAVASISKLPWEQDSYGGSAGWMRDGHELVCLSCAKTSQFQNWGSIEMVDVTHTCRHECAESCGEWVGDKCSTAGCTNGHADGLSICEHCDTHLVAYDFQKSNETNILKLMYQYCSAHTDRWESLCPNFEQFCDVADVFQGNGSIRFPEDFDIDEDDWNDWLFENA